MLRSCNLIMPVATFVVLSWWASELYDVHTRAGRLYQYELDDQAKKLWDQRSAFAPVFGRLVEEVARGRLSLEAGTRKLAALAAEQNPEFLKNVEAAYDGPSFEAKLADNLLSHVERQIAMHECHGSSPRLVQLRSEFEAILRQPGPAATSSSPPAAAPE